MKLAKVLIYIVLVYNKLSIKTIEKANEHKINETIKINFRGPINFLRSYYYAHNDMILKKRVYSPELEYELWIKQVDEEVHFVRPNYRKPKIKKYEEWKEEEIKYVEGYHKVLSLLFQYNDQISVINNGTYSFYKFITNEEIKDESAKLFAGLLLIGEGVPIDLKVKKINKMKYLVLQEEVSFKLPLSFKTKDGEMSYSSVQDIVKIFTTQFVKWPKFVKEADCAEEFSKGLYTMSPNFIMQSYLYELIEDIPEKLIEIAEYCHKILEKYKVRYPKVYSRCFISAENDLKDDGTGRKDLVESNHNDANYYVFNRETRIMTPENVNKDLLMIENIKSNKVVLPFESNENLPKYSAVKLLETRNRPMKPNKHAENETYSNCCEISIFTMLSLLLYDENEKRYKTDHLNRESSQEMIQFFAERNNPRQINYNSVFHQEWSDILADLPCSEIRYVRNKDGEDGSKISNELKSGIVNTLRVICFLCGFKKELVEIQELERQLATDREKKETFENIIRIVFKKISVNKNYKLSLFNLHRTEYNGKQDYTGVVQLRYEKEDTFIALAKLVVLASHQRIELWTRETQFSLRAGLMIKAYKKNDFLIEELHNNLLHGYATKDDKYDLEQRVFGVLEAKDESYISLCGYFGLVLNNLNSFTTTGINAIHFYLILRLCNVYENPMLDSGSSDLVFLRPSMALLAEYARQTSESILCFFLSLFTNMAAAHDLSQESYRNSYLMPLILFGEKDVHFKYINMPINSLFDLFHIPEMLNLISELENSIVPDIWVMNLFKYAVNLSINNFEKGDDLMFPDIFFYYGWLISTKMLHVAVTIFTDYIDTKKKLIH